VIRADRKVGLLLAAVLPGEPSNPRKRSPIDADNLRFEGTMNTQTTDIAQDNPYGVYSPDSIKYFSASDDRNKLYRELAYQDLVKRFQLTGKLLDLGAGCGGTSIVW
jgi:hypothetical protein